MISSDGIVYFYQDQPDAPESSPENLWIARKRHTGKTLWKFNTGEARPAGKPAVGPNGGLYVGLQRGDKASLVALSRSGQKRWSAELGTISGSPVFDGNGALYVSSTDGTIYALDRSSGDRQQLFEIDSPIRSTPVVAEDKTLYFLSGSVNTEGNTIGATAEESEPSHGGDPARSSVWWSWTAPEAGEVVISATGAPFDPVLSVYEGDSLKELTSLASDVSDSHPAHVSLAVSKGQRLQIAVNSQNDVEGTVKLNIDLLPSESISEGSRKWSYSNDQEEIKGIAGTPHPVLNGRKTVYVTLGDGKLYAIEADGTKKWSVQPGDEEFFSSSPTLGEEGTVYVGATDGLYAIRPNGTQKWAFQEIEDPSNPLLL